MPTYKEALNINEKYAIDNNKEDSAIKRLLLHFSNMESSDLILSLSEEMPTELYDNFLYGVDRYITQNIPVQHIIGYEYFFGYKFIVNSEVLIPRFETEELVANVLEQYDNVFNGEPVKVVDIGTGSGCLAVTLSAEEQLMDVTATDISETALEVARANNENLGGRVKFFSGDLYEPLKDQKFDILVSNPPYIPNDEYVEGLVKDNEPHVALFGGKDGLDFYRKIIEGAESILNDKYIIAFEHAYDKAKELKKIINKNIKDVEIIQKKDMQGKDRMTFVIKK
ncbi:Release factor glutamine methyltransferase [Candidatus Izimaplasma bacterium HR1]|jgi:release factor glutamine methyltransferase|uniref:peptide chain release factor N(5)-glutamine methyltransferase n=1 Tax=Candidatus Izimoplasma sp. HR1 TaxID=1541959 RepID=UPI0004F7F23B|nr:Release factor glutamine methyltransferase [Candidatus Izimaplasma bacterium HR1]